MKLPVFSAIEKTSPDALARSIIQSFFVTTWILVVTEFIVIEYREGAFKLLNFINARVETVIDVGCGISGTTLYFLDRGFDVESLAPDRIQNNNNRESNAART